MPELHWYPQIPSEWLADPVVMAMEPAQEGAYRRLVDISWGTGVEEPSLPDDDEVLARLSRLGPAWKRLGPLIRAQFTTRHDEPGRLYHSRMSAKWREQQAKYVRRAVAGRKGGNAKAMLQQSQDAPPSHALALTKQTPSKRLAKGKHLELELEKEVERGSKEPLALPSFAPTAGAGGADAPRPRGATVGENGARAPGDDSDSGRAVNAAAAGGSVHATDRAVERPVETEPRSGNGPATIGEVLDLLRPGRKPSVETAQVALARADAAVEERQAIAFVEADPAMKARLIQTVSDEWGARLKDDARGDAMLQRVWKSACVQAYRAHRDTLPNEVAP